MPDHNSYLQQDILHKPLEKHGLLEEFNLPPKVIKFIRTNRDKIFVAIAGLMVAILAWSYYGHYVATRNDQAAALLNKAVTQEDVEQRAAIFNQVADQFGGTGSAMWAKIELAHLAFDRDDYDDAAGRYQAVLGGLAADSPLLPLVQYNLAQALENKKSFKEAIDAYRKLIALKGFTGEAYLALARIYEVQGELIQVKEMLQKVLELEEVSLAVKNRVKAKLARF
ncbi:MAG: tetratricopeptide repeat protein [Desulfobulbaceae bacterium]|nr:tetratricopeptide repeat protein [Desulfobulbaceae bacterium]HIJ78856.1 tetratricopeptide repeat protein [Deltaproteobacteria bacterium]